MRSFYRSLRIISAVTLFFFVWSFLPLWQAVAYATAPEARKSGARSSESGAHSAALQPGERFEKALDAIRENVGKARDKEDKGEDDTRERDAIKAKKIEVESADVEFKKEFIATEKKLKDAKLPKEILERHYKFVKSYENNLKELKTNLDDIEQAKTGSDRKDKIEKARLHLEKTKKPSTHQKLDPNNLPFKARHATKTREPRLKKEEFEKDFPSQKSRGKGQVASGKGSVPWGQDVVAADFSLRERAKQKPILVASNGSLAGLLSSDKQLPFPSVDTVGSPSEWFNRGVRGSFNSQSTIQNPQWEVLNLAAATTVDAPTTADLAETPEVQFTDDIKALAAQLEYKPVKIYEWVRNNIEFVPTYGSIQGAQMTLESKMGNAFDTASLLIALLRASGISAKYVYATIEIPIEKAMNWVGGVTDPKMAGTILATNSIPVKMLVSGGTYKAVQLEHVYVRAFIDMIPSRGAVHKQGDTWVSLDPSFKQYTYTQGIDVAAAVPFDAQTFADQITSTATINETDGSVTNVNSTLIQTTMQDYQTQVQNYIQQNHPNATVGDVIGKKEIIKQEFPIFMGTLPYKTVQVGAEFSEVPGNYRATMSFSIPDAYGDAGLSYSTTLPQIAGKKITLSFSPATATDQKTIESYLPKAHADGSAVDPSELPTSLPAYLINLKPELRIDGQVVATGSTSMMGKEQSFTMSLNEPGIGLSNIDNTVKAGEYFGIGVDTGRIGTDRLNALKSKVASIKVKIESQNAKELQKDDIIGDMLNATIAAYFSVLDVVDEISAKKQNVIRFRAPSIGMYSTQLKVQAAFGIPMCVGSNGMMMDVDRVMQSVFSKDGNNDNVKPYMLISGNISSALEHAVPEQIYSITDSKVQGISAVKALRVAISNNIPIYTINQDNMASTLSQLEVDADVKSDIVNAVNAGKQVIVSKTNVNFNGWIGCGYIITDTITGAGAYMISGGQSGALIMLIGAILIILGLLSGLGGLGIAVAIFGAMIFFLGAAANFSQYNQQEWITFLQWFLIISSLLLAIMSYPLILTALLGVAGASTVATANTLATISLIEGLAGLILQLLSKLDDEPAYYYSKNRLYSEVLKYV